MRSDITLEKEKSMDDLVKEARKACDNLSNKIKLIEDANSKNQLKEIT